MHWKCLKSQCWSKRRLRTTWTWKSISWKDSSIPTSLRLCMLFRGTLKLFCSYLLWKVAIYSSRSKISWNKILIIKFLNKSLSFGPINYLVQYNIFTIKILYTETQHPTLVLIPSLDQFLTELSLYSFKDRALAL